MGLSRKKKLSKKSGFTIVELLIVVVVIAILAAITLVTYTSIQGRARDSQRQQDVKVIVKALEMYYADYGAYPSGYCAANCVINDVWSNTNDGSWVHLASQLVPDYISELPSDPNPTIGTNPQSATAFGYGYYSNTGTYCGTRPRQTYILIYDLESSNQQENLVGACTTSRLGPYGSKSNYRVAVGGS